MENIQLLYKIKKLTNKRKKRMNNLLKISLLAACVVPVVSFAGQAFKCPAQYKSYPVQVEAGNNMGNGSSITVNGVPIADQAQAAVSCHNGGDISVNYGGNSYVLQLSKAQMSTASGGQCAVPAAAKFVNISAQGNPDAGALNLVKDKAGNSIALNISCK